MNDQKVDNRLSCSPYRSDMWFSSLTAFLSLPPTPLPPLSWWLIHCFCLSQWPSRQIDDKSGQRDVLHLSQVPTARSLSALSGWSLITFWKERSQGVRFMFPTRTGAGAAQETPEDLHCQDDEHQEPVEKHCGAVCQLVSVSCLWPGLHGSLSNQSQHPLCWESMNYTRARPPRVKWSQVCECKAHSPRGRRMSLVPPRCPPTYFLFVCCLCRLTGYGIHHCFARSMMDPEAQPTALCHADYYTMAGIAVATCLALCPAVGLMGRRGGLLTFMIITALASLLQLGLLNCEQHNTCVI